MYIRILNLNSKLEIESIGTLAEITEYSSKYGMFKHFCNFNQLTINK
jgi:hypothetical protein